MKGELVGGEEGRDNRFTMTTISFCVQGIEARFSHDSYTNLH